MNSLELINKLILEKKTDIKVHKELLLYDNSNKVFHNVVIRECEEFITALQQIKTILEAWEIVKKDFILTWEKSNNASGYYLKYFGDIEYEILKKALEVEDDR